MRTVVLIPSRLASKRFPNKPLFRIGDRAVIEHCFDWVTKAGFETYVVSPDREILDLFPQYGIKTHYEHHNGTERCSEAAHILDLEMDDVVINVQGDIITGNPHCLHALAGMARSRKATVFTVLQKTSCCDYRDSNTVKAAISSQGDVLFFTRHPIMSVTDVRSHVGIYAMSVLSLHCYKSRSVCDWERAESLEQIRWLYAGEPIRAYMESDPSISINVPEDVLKG